MKLPATILVARHLCAVGLLALAPDASWAYSCALSAAGDAVIVKTDNRDRSWKQCTVACTFAVPDGYITVTCWQSIPGGAAGWDVCVRPTGDKAFGALAGGSEHCVKPEPDQHPPD
jgi:hypothetical protein